MKISTKIALLSIAVALTSCSADESVKMYNDGKQFITIKVSDIKSRAGRELKNAEAGQNIENVKLILVSNDNKVVWTKTLDKWNTNNSVGGSVLSEDKSYREARIEIPKDEFRLENGSEYHAYAYGYSNGSDYDLSKIEALTVNATYSPNIQITLKDGKVGEEIFAGDCEVIGNVNGINATLTLNRQVAGTFGYFTKIPYVSDAAGNVGKYLILTASNPQKTMALGEFDNINAPSEYKGKYVVNGTVASGADIIYTINIADWFKEIVEAKDSEGRGIGLVAGGDNWKGDPQHYRNGSVYGGNFLVPFEKVADKSTFLLHLCYENDINTAMRVWNVILRSDASQLAEYSYLKYAEGAWATAKTTDDYVVYNVLRNHLYGVGIKAMEALDAATPDDPSDDPDDVPEPINNKQELTITVNGEWNAIYNMGVE